MVNSGAMIGRQQTG